MEREKWKFISSSETINYDSFFKTKILQVFGGVGVHGVQSTKKIGSEGEEGENERVREEKTRERGKEESNKNEGEKSWLIEAEQTPFRFPIRLIKMRKNSLLKRVRKNWVRGREIINYGNEMEFPN